VGHPRYPWVPHIEASVATHEPSIAAHVASVPAIPSLGAAALEPSTTPDRRSHGPCTKLRSVSHDLRSPPSSLPGAANVIAMFTDRAYMVRSANRRGPFLQTPRAGARECACHSARLRWPSATISPSPSISSHDSPATRHGHPLFTSSHRCSCLVDAPRKARAVGTEENWIRDRRGRFRASHLRLTDTEHSEPRDRRGHLAHSRVEQSRT
jgi:hypothetical protein